MENQSSRGPGPDTAGPGPDTAGPEANHIEDILLEMFEVAINTILYVRNIYPCGIFERYQKYNMAVMMSKHPEVNLYISNVLCSIKPLIHKNEIEKMIVQINDKNGLPLDKFCFDLKLKQFENKVCYLELESHLRSFLLKLMTCNVLLRPPSKECTFQVLIHTNMSSCQHLFLDKDQDFPWITENEVLHEETAIIPIRSCDTQLFSLQCYVEDKKQNEEP